MHHISCDRHFFNYNTDLSGDVEIGLHGISGTFRVNGQDLLDFLAEVVRLRRISRLEEATTDELLFGRQPPETNRCD